MKSGNSFLKEAGVLLIVSMMVFSSGIVLANTNNHDVRINTNELILRNPNDSIGTSNAAPNLTIEQFKGGFFLSAVVKNIGDAPATNITWSIDLQGKMIFLGNHTTGGIPSIAPGDTVKIRIGPLILGFGKINIVAIATCEEGATYTEYGTAFLLIFFVVGVSEPLP